MIAVFFSRLFYPHIGGVEKHTFEVSKRLIQKGFKVIVFTELYDKNLAKKQKYKGFTIYRIPVRKDDWFKKFRIWKTLFEYRAVIKEADVIHCHDVFFWYLPFRFLYPTKRVFTTFHGYEGNTLPRLKAKGMHFLAEKLSARTIGVGAFLKKWYGTNLTYITYGGINIPKSIKKEKENSFRCVFLGRLEEETGIQEYLRALRILKDKKYDIEVIALGDGLKRKMCEAYAKKNYLRVEFKGFVSSVDDYLRSADLILTSRYLGILESFAFKKFVLAHYNNSIKYDYLTMTPFWDWIGVCKDSGEIASSIERFMKKPSSFQDKINHAFTWVQSQTWDTVVDLYLDLWNK